MYKKANTCCILFLVLLILLIVYLETPSMISSDYSDVSKIMLYLNSVDISTINDKYIVPVEKEIDIAKIIQGINTTTNIKRVSLKKDTDNFTQNNPSGYIEIIYKDGLTEKIYFTENKKAIYRFYKSGFVYDCVYGKNSDLFQMLEEYTK